MEQKEECNCFDTIYEISTSWQQTEHKEGCKNNVDIINK